MTTEAKKLQILEVLVDELLKAQPAESLVQKCMSDVGIPDSRDPIDRINKVLMALHFEESGKEMIE
jgi:hypothetical protein